VDAVHSQEQLLGRLSSGKTRDTPVFDPNGLARDKYTPPEEKNAQFWYDIANEEIAKRVKLPQADKRKAKNLIMFLGDGMSLSTVAAARILKGQLKGNTGEEDSLSFEQFPHTGLSRVSIPLNSRKIKYSNENLHILVDLLLQCSSGRFCLHSNCVFVWS